MSARLLVSFSGGETSALMTKIIHERWQDRYDEIVTVFANTGQENEQTLEFIQRCDEEWGWNVVWVEAITDPRPGIGVRARTVDFASADRDGTVFEAMIAKHGIPGPGFPHCTRELKERAITAYVRSLEWTAGSYDTAIGIRIDEIDRMNPRAPEKRLVYPMVKPFPHRKIDVNEFWIRHPWRLPLKGYQGNCKWCWKKSLRKHLTIMTETPAAFDFPERMEAKYQLAGANPMNEPKYFFRGKLTVADIRKLAAEGTFEPADDDARQYQTDLLHTFDLDVGGGCEDSCEVDFTSEDTESEAA